MIPLTPSDISREGRYMWWRTLQSSLHPALDQVIMGPINSLRAESLLSSSEHCPSPDEARNHVNLHPRYPCVPSGSMDAPMMTYPLFSMRHSIRATHQMHVGNQ
jgi:hypothetical protein